MYTWSSAMTLPRCSGCGSPSGSHNSLTKETPTTCGPASIDARTSSPASPLSLHVLFPFRVSGKTRLSVPGITRSGGPALGCSPNREALEQLAIQPNIELLRPPHPFDVVLILPLQTNFDEVLTRGREVMANRDPATRPERQVFTLPVVLQHMQRDLETFQCRNCRRQTDCQPRHLPCHGKVSLEMSGRDRQRTREVVEAAVSGFIARQQWLHVDIEREEIADGVVVFGSIQTMNSADPAGIWIGGPGLSIWLSSEVATARYAAESGRGSPGGGIEPARNLAITRSQVSACLSGAAASMESSASPPV